MRAQIRELFSLEVDQLDRYVPADTLDFSVSIRLVAGPAGEDGAESFDFIVCSPARLASQIRDGSAFLVRHVVLVERFDFSVVRKFVERFVHSCDGADWLTIAAKLSRLGQWEFEDYSE